LRRRFPRARGKRTASSLVWGATSPAKPPLPHPPTDEQRPGLPRRSSGSAANSCPFRQICQGYLNPPRLPRAVLLFKLREAEKAERREEALVGRRRGGGGAAAAPPGGVMDAAAQPRHPLRRRALAYPAGVLSQRHIPPVVRAVLDAPVLTRQRQHRRRVR